MGKYAEAEKVLEEGQPFAPDDRSFADALEKASHHTPERRGGAMRVHM